MRTIWLDAHLSPRLGRWLSATFSVQAAAKKECANVIVICHICNSFRATLSSLMSFTGTVERGMIKLPPEVALPDGTKVRIEPLPSASVRLQIRHGYLVAVGSRRITWEETRRAMDEFP